MLIGRQSFGIKAPLIVEGDDLTKIIPDAILRAIEPQDGDIIGITESIVARAQGNYVTLDEITREIKQKNVNNLPIRVINPIYSRNRFAMILKAIAKATDNITLVLPNRDEVGNVLRQHPFTGLNYDDYYREICKDVKRVCITNEIHYTNVNDFFNIDCSLRPNNVNTSYWITLRSLCQDKTEYGLLGSNKATEDKLKLFPNTQKAQDLVNTIQSIFKQKGYNVEVMIYGDGCFKDPVGGIWEFADPVTSPAYTSGLRGTPNEIKLKAFIDSSNLSGKELEEYIKWQIQNKPETLIGNMSSEGTTPRNKIDLLASLMDLTSGSGDAGTPIVIVRNYATTY